MQGEHAYNAKLFSLRQAYVVSCPLQLQTLCRWSRLQQTQPQTTALGVCSNSCSCTMVWQFHTFAQSITRIYSLILHAYNAGRLFPHQDMFKWLAYGNGESSDFLSHCKLVTELLVGMCCRKPFAQCSDSKHPQADAAYFHKREFCFTLDGDIFVRYQSFKARTVVHFACHYTTLIYTA